MGGNNRGKRAESTWTFLLALLCVLLVAVAGTVQVAHTHAGGADTHAACSLCATAHLAVQIVQTPAPAPSVAIVAVLETLPPSIVPSARSTFALFTRPPPVFDIVPA